MRKIYFKSGKETITGNLFLPKQATIQGVLILHGAGKSIKERYSLLQKG